MSLLRGLGILHWGYPYMIVWAIAIHINTGLFILLDHRVATLLPFIGLKELTEIGLPVHALGLGLMAVGSLAALGLAIESRVKPKVTLIFILPQYGLMVAAFLSDSRLLIEGVKNSAGQPVAFTLLEPLVFLIMSAALLHTLSIIERFVIGPRRDDD